MKPFTSDPELLRDTLSNIMVAIERIKRRFEDIKSAEDFLSSDDAIRSIAAALFGDAQSPAH